MERKMITEKELEILQRSNQNLPKYMYGLSDRHYATLVAEAHQTGLLYVAKNTLGKSILPIHSLVVDESSGNATLSTRDPEKGDEKKEFVIGSRGFLENALADAYVGGICGCQLDDLDQLRGLARLLPYGNVYYNILATDCGSSFANKSREFTGYDDKSKTFMQAHNWRPNPLVEHYTKKMNLPRGLAERLHFVVTLRGGGDDE